MSTPHTGEQDELSPEYRKSLAKVFDLMLDIKGMQQIFDDRANQAVAVALRRLEGQAEECNLYVKDQFNQPSTVKREAVPLSAIRALLEEVEG